jgi:hypothetical protein
MMHDAWLSPLSFTMSTLLEDMTFIASLSGCIHSARLGNFCKEYVEGGMPKAWCLKQPEDDVFTASNYSPSIVHKHDSMDRSLFYDRHDPPCRECELPRYTTRRPRFSKMNRRRTSRSP